MCVDSQPLSASAPSSTTLFGRRRPLMSRRQVAGGLMILNAEAVAAGQASQQIIIRTRFWDDALLDAHDGVSQVVILAAGMDARSYRLPWRAGTTVYEVDQPRVITIKDARLAGEQPRCRRVAVGVDLADDWPKALRAQGFNSSARTVWLIEGLLQYLDAADVDRLFARVDELSAPG